MGLSVRELLERHVETNEALRSLGVLRSANNPTGDLAEWLFCGAFGWSRMDNSVKSFDARDGKTRIQIKARRTHSRNQSRLLSAIRDFDGFDILAGVIFGERYEVLRAALVPVTVVRSLATSRSLHTNSYRFHLRETVWKHAGVRDVTSKLKAYQDRNC